MPGFVSLVGAGPWNPQLLTLQGLECLRRADVVIADYLVNPALLLHCRPDAEVIQRSRGPHNSGMSLDQRAVSQLLVDRAQQGKYVVRLKGGDPMVFGRGSEEAIVLREAGIAYAFVPGVSAAIAAPEVAGIPITQRDHTPSVSLISGYEAYDKRGRGVGWEHMARHGGTLVLMMSVRNCRKNAERLVASGRDPNTDVALVRWGTRGIQQTVVGTLATIGDAIEAANLRPPAVMIVGSVVSLREQIKWIESRPLFGRRVVITRAFEQSHDLLAQLAHLGADAVPVPCLRVEPTTDLLLQAIRTLRDHDGLIFSSTNAVEQFFSAITGELDLRSLVHTKIAAIGERTAGALRKRGIIPDIIADPPNSEGMVDQLREAEELARQWLHVRAQEGRDVLETAITQAGGRYQVAVAYRLSRPSLPGNLLTSLRPHEDGGEGIDVLCFASTKTAEHFLAAVDEAWGTGAGVALVHRTHAKVVVIGPVTRRGVENLGLPVADVADTPSTTGVLAAVCRLCAASDARSPS